MFVSSARRDYHSEARAGKSKGPDNFTVSINCLVGTSNHNLANYPSRATKEKAPSLSRGVFFFLIKRGRKTALCHSPRGHPF